MKTGETLTQATIRRLKSVYGPMFSGLGEEDLLAALLFAETYLKYALEEVQIALSEENAHQIQLILGDKQDDCYPDFPPR